MRFETVVIGQPLLYIEGQCSLWLLQLVDELKGQENEQLYSEFYVHSRSRKKSKICEASGNLKTSLELRNS